MIGPWPKHEVVPRAVRAAVAAAMTIRRSTSQSVFFFIVLFIFVFNGLIISGTLQAFQGKPSEQPALHGKPSELQALRGKPSK